MYWLVLLLWGGNANNGSNCGLVYSNSNNAWSNANSNIAARHTFNGISGDGRLYLITAITTNLGGRQTAIQGCQTYDNPEQGSYLHGKLRQTVMGC